MVTMCTDNKNVAFPWAVSVEIHIFSAPSHLSSLHTLNRKPRVYFDNYFSLLVSLIVFMFFLVVA